MQWEAPSMPTAAYDPRLLHELETPLEIEKDWFLDQKIPAGGFVRILDSSQGMGRTSGRNENHHDRRSDHMSGPRTRMDNQSQAGDGTFLKNRSVGKATSKC